MPASYSSRLSFLIFTHQGDYVFELVGHISLGTIVFKSPKYIIKIISSESQTGECRRFLLPSHCLAYKKKNKSLWCGSDNDPNFTSSTPISWNIVDMERQMCVRMSRNGFGPKFYGSYEYKGKD